MLKNQKIIIYGTGIAGKKACELFEEENVEVIGFIDKRHNEIQAFMEKPVYGILDIVEISAKDKYTILITIKNVYDHTEIANQLLKAGFHNIICKPYEILQGKKGKYAESIDRAYETLIDKGKIYLEYIETYGTKQCLDLVDEGIIEMQEDYVKTYINATLLFTNQKADKDWDSLNFVSTFPGVEMYYALDSRRLGKQTAIFKEFTDFCAEGAVKGGIELSESWEKNIIENRGKIFGEMKRMYSLRKDFFVENCPKCEYLDEGKFRIVSSGKNRIAFLISQGDWYIPIQIEQEQYQKYIYMEQAKKVNDLLGNDVLWYSIPHPMFYSRKVVAYNYLDTWIPIVGRYISNCVKREIDKYDFSRICIEDYSQDDGAISRHLRRMGAIVKRKTDDTQLCQELDKLFRFDNREFHQMENEPADFCIETYSDALSNGMGVLCDKKRTKMRFVLLIGEKCKSEFFHMNKQSRNMQLIFESVWDGKHVEGYVFL